MQTIDFVKGVPVVRSWNQFARLITGEYSQSFTPGTAEHDRAWNAYSGGVSGGYLVDAQLSGSFWDKARAIDGPLKRCLVLPTNKKEFWLPVTDESSRIAGSRMGGIRAYWRGKDDSQMSQSKPSIAKLSFTLNDVYIYSEGISNDLLDDAPLLETVLDYSAHCEISYAITDAMINGNGIKCPLGVLNSPATVQVTRNTSSQIKIEDIHGMWSKLWCHCKRNAVWHATDSVIDEIDAVANTAGFPQNLYMPMGAYGNPYPLLKGRPLIAVEQTSKLGTYGDLVLADWSQYALAVRVVDGESTAPSFELGFGRPGLEAERSLSSHKGFNTDEVYFKYKSRLDGAPLWIQQVKLADGSNQFNGPFVALN